MLNKKLITAFALAGVLCAGCNRVTPSVETIPDETSRSAEQTAEDPMATMQTLPPETEAPTQATTEEAADPTVITIDITPQTESTSASSSGRMEAAESLYETGNIKVKYPTLVGMENQDVQAWANDEIYKDLTALLKYYDVDPENDTLTMDFKVSTIYRSEFSFVYTGELTKASNGYNTRVTAAEDLDLSGKKHIRLSDRLSAAKLTKSVLEEDDYTIIDSQIDDVTLRQYLAQQNEDFYAALIKDADFGGPGSVTGSFSYNSMGNVAVIIPLPHVMGDYATISIKQQTK